MKKLTIDELGIMIGDGFKETDRKIEELRTELKTEMNTRFDGVESTMEHRFDEVSSRLTGVEKRLWIVESRSHFNSD